MMNIEGFKIDTFVFIEYYVLNETTKKKISTFLFAQRKDKSIEEFYEAFISRKAIEGQDVSGYLSRLTYKEKWKENFLDGPSQTEMVRQLIESCDIEVNPPGYSFKNRVNKYHFPSFDGPLRAYANGVILNSPFQLDYTNADHKPLFVRLFTEILSQTDWPEEFLTYHLTESFQDNIEDYEAFLTRINDDNDLKRKKTLQLWLDRTRKARTNGYNNFETDRVHINKNFINEIVSALDGKFANDSGEKLQLLLDGKHIPEKLIFDGAAVDLIGVFWTLRNCRLINDSAYNLTAWIVKYFQFKKADKNRDMTLSTVSKWLGGQSNPSSKPIFGINAIEERLKQNHS